MATATKESIQKVGKKTMLGILNEIERYITSTHSLSEIRKKFLEFSDNLLEIHQDGLIKYQQKAQKEGKEWAGRLLVTSYMNEQDRHIWWGDEIVEIGEKVKISFNHTSCCGKVEEFNKLEVVSSADGKALERVWYQLSKIFDRYSKSEESIILYQAMVEFKDSQICRVEIERNIDTAPSEWGSFYHHPAKATIKHEVCV